MKNFKKVKHNPIELIERFWPEANHSHIQFDDNLKPRKGQFDIIRQSGGDGTALFTIQMLQDVLINPMNMQSHFKGDEPDFKRLKAIKYRVGSIYHAVAFGRVELKCGGKYPGQVERARMPVICEYVY